VRLPTFIVEDRSVVLEGLSEALEELGSVRVVGSAGSAPGAIHWLTGHPDAWRLVIVDLFLIRGSGIEVLEACRGREDFQRAIVLTNYATEEIRRRCAALGADAVFDKSTEIEELIAYVHDYASLCDAGGDAMAEER
jgi:two-component system OmpR family response regulator